MADTAGGPRWLEGVREDLEARKMPARERVGEALRRLARREGSEEVLSAIAPTLHRLGDPLRALTTLEECIEKDRPLLDVAATTAVLELSGASSWAARLLAADPGIAVALLEGPELNRPIERYDPLTAPLTNADTSELFDRQLRAVRNRALLRIALRELRGADIRETSAEIADLAGACVRATLNHHRPRLLAEHGLDKPPCDFVIIGMGKLGGAELNFSSDIDVLYFYAHDDGAVGELTPHEFHVKLIQRLHQSLGRVTEDGFVFRVDADLRPEGRGGPLANSLTSAERYYQTWGRTWERAAWIKARPVAGEMQLGDQVLEMMTPFIYRRSFDLKAIESIMAMKDKIDRQRKRRSFSGLRRGLDLKLEHGGIREIEFFVQAQQLLHGGRNSGLRERNTLGALQQLEAAGLVGARDRDELSAAYLLLRAVEHRLQIVDDRQTHTLPTGDEAQDAIARSLGHADRRPLAASLEAHMASVHQIFTGMHQAAQDNEPLPADVDTASDNEASGELREAALRALGCADPHAALNSLEGAARHPSSPFHPRAPRGAARLARTLLHDCVRSPDVDRALRHLPQLVTRLVRNPALVRQLKAPALRRGVARVLGASDLLARILTASPALLSHVLVSGPLPRSEGLAREVAERMKAVGDDIEAGLSILRSFKQEHILRTAMADMADQIDARAVGERLTMLATTLIGAALSLAKQEVTKKYGELKDQHGQPAELVVIAGGSLGAQEMGYRTDLDLSFVFIGRGQTTGGRRGRIGCRELFTRLVQVLLRNLTMKTAQGDLYPVDMRLRPSGNQGPLVTTLESFEAYHARAAQLWERQALTRTRTVMGGAGPRARVDAVIAAAAYDPRPTEDIPQRIDAMLTRMQKSKRAPPARGFDVKLGTGGLVEIQFLLQCLLLQHGPEGEALRTTSAYEALQRLGEAQILPPETTERLADAYHRLRAVQNWLRISQDRSVDFLSFEEAALRPVALAVGYQGEDAHVRLTDDLLTDAKWTHRCYTKVVNGA